MRALVYDRYGTPDVLHVADVAEPHAGPGQVRIAVRAAGVNPIDWKIRRGYLADGADAPPQPVVPGADAAGVVDEVGDGVDGVAVGDEVLGQGERVTAEHAVLDRWLAKPDAVTFEVAAGLPVPAATAGRVLGHVALEAGDLVVVDGAAGGVGTVLVQLAVQRGLRVVGTASEANHEYLRGLGVEPLTYGPGLPKRVADLVDVPVAAAFDLAGAGSVPELVELTGDPGRVVSIADFGAGEHGAVVSDGSEGSAWDVVAEATGLVADGRLTLPVQATYPLADGSAAHAESETGHVRGKVVVTLP